MKSQRFTLLFAGALALGSAAGCKSPPADLREWRPSDHSGESAPAGASAGAAGAPSDDDGDPALAARALWQVQCSNCHGREGHGDGPQGAITHPPDMATVAFQSSHSDEVLAQSIRQGKGMMPAFGAGLRPEAVQALVRIVRGFGGR